MKSITIGKNEYIEFLRVLTALKEHCCDINIVNGISRQRIENRSSMYEIDLRHIFGDTTILINYLKEKIDLFKLFYGEEVILNVEENVFYSIQDDMSRYTFKWPDIKTISENSRFIPEEEIKILIGNYKDIVLETQIDKKISDRIKFTTQLFNVRNFTINFKDQKASFFSEHQNKEQNAVFMTVDSNLLDEAHIHLGIVPLIVDHDGNVDYELSSQVVNKKVQLLQTVNMKIGNTDLTFYGASVLKTEEED